MRFWKCRYGTKLDGIDGGIVFPLIPRTEVFGVFWREGDVRGHFVRGMSRVGELVSGLFSCLGSGLSTFHVGRKPGKPDRLVGLQSGLVLGDSGK